MRTTLDTNSIADYQRFLKIKTLPSYRIVGRTAEFPDEYARLLGGDDKPATVADYAPHIGSEMFIALKNGRRAYGCEIKQEYMEAASANCQRAEKLANESERLLFT